MKFGDFLVKSNVIKGNDLQKALELQRDNPDRKIGEIFVTLGLISKEELIRYIEAYMFETGKFIEDIEEWFDQDEIDLIWERFEKKKKH